MLHSPKKLTKKQRIILPAFNGWQRIDIGDIGIVPYGTKIKVQQ
jgi:hypothetical protein